MSVCPDDNFLNQMNSDLETLDKLVVHLTYCQDQVRSIIHRSKFGYGCMLRGDVGITYSQSVEGSTKHAHSIKHLLVGSLCGFFYVKVLK